MRCRPLEPALEAHLRSIVKAIAAGRLVPFLGAGANLCGRRIVSDWKPDGLLPGGRELARWLAETFDCAEAPDDLSRVSQQIVLANGSGPLYEELHAVFDRDYPPTSLHGMLAAIPGHFRSGGLAPKFQLIITTNYDDVLERAFADAGEAFEVVSYIADGRNKGKFVHRDAAGGVRVIDKPNEYSEVGLDRRTVILKIHGAVDRTGSDLDSYVITEDHYIDYLTRTEIENLVPVTLTARLRRSNFLFLGYGLRDWNLRVILHRIWGEARLSYASWAVQMQPGDLDRRFWAKRDVEILDMSLDRYVAHLRRRIERALAGGRPVNV